MFKKLNFLFLWLLFLQNQNCIDALNHDLDVELINKGDNTTLDRYPRVIKSRIDKPVECAKLHTTEETPFVAIILNRASGRLLCMGSVIDEKHILTANRCVQHTDHKTLRILLGYYKAWWGRHSYVFYVKKVFKHEHNLVILRLTRSITFSRFIRPIRLLHLPPKQGSKVEQKSGTQNDLGANAATGPSPLHKTTTLNDENKKNESNVQEGNPDKNNQTKVHKKPNRNKKMKNNPFKEENRKSDDKKLANNSEDDSKDKENGEKKKEKLEGPEVGLINSASTSINIKNKSSLLKREEDSLQMLSKSMKADIKSFTTTHADIKNVLLVGFTLTSYDVIGDPIPQTLIYTMKEDIVEAPGEECLKIYHPTPSLPDDEDKNRKNREFCTPGKTKFCWGCLGGPTLYKQDNEYVLVGVVGGADCDKDKGDKPAPYLHIRVDIFIDWILANSAIPQKL